MAEPIAIVKLHDDDDGRRSDSRPRHLVLGAVAAILVALGIGFGLGNLRGDQPSTTESVEGDGQQASGEGISYETARALVEGAGGIDGPVLTNDGNLLARPLTQNQLGPVVNEGERPLIVSANRDDCPTRSVQVGGPEQATLLNQDLNRFARVGSPNRGWRWRFPTI